MGKVLTIKDADFSMVAVEKINLTRYMDMSSKLENAVFSLSTGQAKVTKGTNASKKYMLPLDGNNVIDFNDGIEIFIPKGFTSRAIAMQNGTSINNDGIVGTGIAVIGSNPFKDVNRWVNAEDIYQNAGVSKVDYKNCCVDLTHQVGGSTVATTAQEAISLGVKIRKRM